MLDGCIICCMADVYEAATEIRAALDPARCKKLGEQVNVDERRWLVEAMRVMRTACLAKFTQNPTAKQFLLKTGDNELAEAGPNKTWGVGLRLDNPQVHNKTEWKGENCLGEILKGIRNELRQ